MNYFYLSAAGLVIVLTLIVISEYNKVKQAKNEITKIQNEKKSLQEEYQSLKMKYEHIQKDVTELHSELEKHERIDSNRQKWLEEYFNENVHFYPFLAGSMADYITYDIEILAKELDWGWNQERKKKVASIRAIREDAQHRIAEAKVAIYQLNYLLELYPSLEEILDTNYNDLDFSSHKIPEYDPIHDYLAKEEWESLSPTERNQRALDNYIASHRKSKWQIGRDYELSVGYEFSQKGYEVEYYGENNGLSDLGRDLICKKGSKTLIIQCKYWGQEKKIHEKHIYQLFGTTTTYCLENELKTETVTPVFVTNISLSEMAKKAAQQLNIQVVENHLMRDFPRIKCNVGVNEYGEKTKIYHLPMDQQYDIIKMKKDGTFWARTVAEAESLGYRRAYKWHGEAKEFIQ